MPKEEPVLRALFSQITAEVRKKGVVLGDEEGSFYVSDRFGWKVTVREFFDAYHKICDRKQVKPIYQESKLNASLKVPFASLETIRLFHDGVAKRLLQFRQLRIPPFHELSASPSDEELRRLMKREDDPDIRSFLERVVLVDEELRRYVSQLDELAKAYELRLTAFGVAYSGSETEESARRKEQEARRRIESVLLPYIGKLKKKGIIPSSWTYSYQRLPLTEDARRYLGIIALSQEACGYWEKDVLPLKSVREAERAAAEREAARRREREAAERKRREEERAAAEREAARRKEREAAERKRREEDRAAAEREAARRREHEAARRREHEAAEKKRREASIRPSGAKGGFDLSRPSWWERFDKRISRIGDRIASEKDDFADKLMRAWIVLAIILAVLILIYAWVNGGFVMAVVLFLVGAAFFGFLAGVVGIIGMVLRVLASGVLSVLRYMFYNARSFIFSWVLVALYVLYRILGDYLPF